MSTKGFCTVTKNALAASTSVVVEMATTISISIYLLLNRTCTQMADRVQLVKQTNSFILSVIISPHSPQGNGRNGYHFRLWLACEKSICDQFITFTSNEDACAL